MSDREKEIAAVTARLDRLLDDLAASVAALTAILHDPPPDDEARERLVAG